MALALVALSVGSVVAIRGLFDGDYCNDTNSDPVVAAFAELGSTTAPGGLDPVAHADCDQEHRQPHIAESGQVPAQSSSAQVLTAYRVHLQRLGWSERFYAPVGRSLAGRSLTGTNLCSEIRQTARRTLTVTVSVPGSGHPFNYDVDMIADTTGHC